MSFRGWLELGGVEIANSSRAVAHLSPPTPTSDAAVFGQPRSCGCGGTVVYDDSWPGLADYLDHDPYTDVTQAPWYDPAIPQSSEFRGIWPMKIDGLGPAARERKITELIGDGAIAGQSRIGSRRITVDALLIACSSAGLQYGINWLDCALRAGAATEGAVLSYLDAHPGHSAVDPDTLLRTLHNIVYTDTITDSQEIAAGGERHRQGTSARVTFSLTALSPHAYRPGTAVLVDWDSVSTDAIGWVHATDCTQPASCDMPILFSTECAPIEWPRATYLPPVCGGCIPVGDIKTYRYGLPDPGRVLACGETAVSLRIVNTGGTALSLQGGMESCTPGACGGEQFPFQISALPSATELILDAPTGRNWAIHNGVRSRTFGIVSTPRGRPWRPAIISRGDCWELVVRAAASAEFEIELTLAERDT